MDYVIETHQLSKKFGILTAVDGIDINVQRGGVYGFLGPNGAGKTTTIKMIMNIIAPTTGKSIILNVPSSQLGSDTLRKIGYVSENQELPLWMTVKDFLKYCRSFYPAWDDALCRNLINQFDLPVDRKMADLSRGMRMKASLISSLAYRPQLLVLDEPFSGLDPVVKEDLISGFLTILQNQDWTIFLSSHDMEEVERLSDRIGMLDQGKLCIQEETASLIHRFKKVDILMSTPINSSVDLPNTWHSYQQNTSRVTFTVSDYSQEETENKIKKLFPGHDRLEVISMTLKEVFVALAKQRSS